MRDAIQLMKISIKIEPINITVYALNIMVLKIHEWILAQQLRLVEEFKHSAIVQLILQSLEKCALLHIPHIVGLFIKKYNQHGFN